MFPSKLVQILKPYTTLAMNLVKFKQNSGVGFSFCLHNAYWAKGSKCSEKAE